MKSGIYKILAPSGSFYIGSAVDLKARRRQHFHLLRKRKHYSRPLQRAADKYGIDQLKFLVMIICRKSDLIFFEQIAIDGLYPKLNSRKIAESQFGLRHSSSTKEKISAAKSGVPIHSIEHKMALSVRMTGNKHNLGKRLSDEHRANVSSALKGRSHKDGFLQNLTPEIKKSIIERYIGGEGFVSISINLGTSHHVIKAMLIAEGIELRRLRKQDGS